MAAPTAPTIDLIADTALKDAGYSNPSSALISEATGAWTRSIKNEIWVKQKRILSLQKSAVAVVTEGLSRYSNPDDYATGLSLMLLGGTLGTAQTGGAGTITLSASEPTSDVVGREIFIYSGTGIGSISQCYSYDASTKIALVSPAWETNPAASSGYMIVTEYTPIREAPAWRMDELRFPTAIQKPSTFHPVGDEDFGEFIFDTVPDTTYGVRMRYYANLMSLDLSSTALATFLSGFESVFSKGIFAKALKRKDDDRWLAADADYRKTLVDTCNDGKYGSDISDMQSQVKDY